MPSNPIKSALDERTRYPICQPVQLERLYRSAGLNAVESGEIEIAAEFRGFDDYWTPFLAGYGPASAYLLSLPGEAQERLRERLRDELIPDGEGTFSLPIHALSVRGVK